MTKQPSIDETEAMAAPDSDGVRRPDRGRTWNRKLHYYLGLYLLLFLWLFALSGLLINHPRWTVAKSWSRRQETVSDRSLSAVPAGSDDEQASAIMRELAIVGERSDIHRDTTGTRLEFQVVRPGRNYRVAANLSAHRVTLTEIRLDRWGAMDAMHKLTGVRLDKPQEHRDWIMTRIWSLAMDALAIGLIVLVGTGIYLWLRLGTKRTSGSVALTLGVIGCALLLYGQRLLR